MEGTEHSEEAAEGPCGWAWGAWGAWGALLGHSVRGQAPPVAGAAEALTFVTGDLGRG